jgi:hypothetical protein
VWIGLYQLAFVSAWRLSAAAPPGAGSALLLALMSIALLWRAPRSRLSIEAGLLYLTVGTALALRALVISGWGQ